MVRSLPLTNPVAVHYMSQSVIEKIAVSPYSSLEKLLRVTAICL